MNPATLVNLSTGQSSFITVEIDQDGDLATDDRVPQPGSFGVEVSFEQLRTTLTFTPTGGFPSGGSASSPRLMVLSLPPTALDIVGNPLQNPGQTFFQTELIDFPPLVLPEPDPEVPGDLPGEQFQNQNNLDVARSGADWGDGRLTYGRGGGSGRLGALTVLAGAANAITLDTESQTFPLAGQPRDLLDNAVPGVDYDPSMPATWPTVTVTTAPSSSRGCGSTRTVALAITGAAPARVFSRGAMLIDGTVDLAGGQRAERRVEHRQQCQQRPGDGPGRRGRRAAVPAAGAGGAGADRFNHGDNDAAGCQTLPMLTAGGIMFSPSPPRTTRAPTTTGGPARGSAAERSAPGRAACTGRRTRRASSATPIPTARCASGDLEYVIVPDPGSTTGLDCRVAMVGGAGAGGAYALDGSSGVAGLAPGGPGDCSPATCRSRPPPTSGGSRVDGGPRASRRSGRSSVGSTFEDGNLRGGSGGGGGGMSIYGTKTRHAARRTSTDCTTEPQPVPRTGTTRGAAAAAAVARCRLVSGTALTIGLGRLDRLRRRRRRQRRRRAASTSAGCTNARRCPDCEAVRRARRRRLGRRGAAAVAGRSTCPWPSRTCIVDGGMGGVGSTGSVGGDGSPGLVRIEKANRRPGRSARPRSTPLRSGP